VYASSASERFVASLPASTSISVNEYLDLVSPCFDWLFHIIGIKGKKDLFDQTLKLFISYTSASSSVLLNILNNFPAASVSSAAQEIAGIIREVDVVVPKARLYAAFGRALIASPPAKGIQLPLLNEVWKFVSKLEDPEEYAMNAEVYVQYILALFSVILAAPGSYN
jgi:hypothetical protein